MEVALNSQAALETKVPFVLVHRPSPIGYGHHDAQEFEDEQLGSGPNSSVLGANSFAPLTILFHAKILMGMRRDARERAVQFLFQYDLNQPEDLEAALRVFWE